MLAASAGPAARPRPGLRDGINACIDYARPPDPDQVPGEFAALQDLPIDRLDRRATPRGSGSSWRAPSPPATARSSTTRARCSGSAARDFETLLPLRSPRRLTTVPRSRGRLPLPARPHPRRRAGRLRRKSQRSRPPRPRRRHRHGGEDRRRRPGGRASCRAAEPAAARSCGRSATARRSAPTSSTARSSASRSPSCSSSSSCTRRRSDIRGVSAAGVPVLGHRPQRPRRLGLHLRALRRGRPLRREGDRRRRPTASRAPSGRWTAATRSSTSARRRPTSRRART